MQIYFSGFALNVIPGRLGELIKSQLLKKNFRISRKISTPIVIIEQVYTVIGLIIFSILGILYFEIGAYVIGAFSLVLISILAVIQSKTLFDKIFSFFRISKRLEKIIDPL